MRLIVSISVWLFFSHMAMEVVDGFTKAGAPCADLPAAPSPCSKPDMLGQHTVGQRASTLSGE
ncbi:MAG: hypothetical protein HY820_45915 [Acidobacteria bacterium]|nr:hypothetical protein [Acidobacteriota bacterium]